MTLIERARDKRAQSIDKIPSEIKQNIIDRIMSAAEDGYSHVRIDDIEENEARLINLWVIKEGFRTDIRDYKSCYRKSIVIWW